MRPDTDTSAYSALMPANLTTLAHFSVSSAMNFSKSAGEPSNRQPFPAHRSRHGQWPQLAGLDVLNRSGNVVEHDLHLSGNQIG